MLLSLAIVLLGGYIFGKISEMLKLPRLVGMLLFGIVIGPFGLNYLDKEFLMVAPYIKEIALIVILMRAGMSLDIEDLKKIGLPAVLMSFLPACFEIAATTFIAPILLHISYMDALLLGTIVASSSPAVIVPRMVYLMEHKIGTDKQIPQLILAGDSIDDVFNIVLFTMVLDIQTSSQLHVEGLLTLPLHIILGVVVGIVVGFIVYLIFKHISIVPTMKVLMLLGVAFLLVTLESYIPFSALLSVMVMGIVLYKSLPVQTLDISRSLSNIWVGAEIFLFVLLGTSVNIAYASNEVVPTIILLVLVLAIRAIGINICLITTNFNKKEKIFCMLTGIPKATVQAAIGGIPLSLGLASGNLMLSVAVISILFTAPIGAFLLDHLHPKLLMKQSK